MTENTLLELNLAPSYTLRPYLRPEEIREFPFREGSQVTVRLLFEGPLRFNEDLAAGMGVADRAPVLGAWLVPFGEDFVDYVLSEIGNVDDGKTYIVRFPIEKDTFALALVCANDEVQEFPVEDGQLVTTLARLKGDIHIPINYANLQFISRASGSTVIVECHVVSRCDCLPDDGLCSERLQRSVARRMHKRPQATRSRSG